VKNTKRGVESRVMRPLLKVGGGFLTGGITSCQDHESRVAWKSGRV